MRQFFARKSCTVVINPSVASAKLFSDNAVIIKIKKIECTSNAINYVGDLDSEYIMLISNNEKIIDATKKYTAKKTHETLRNRIRLFQYEH